MTEAINSDPNNSGNAYDLDAHRQRFPLDRRTDEEILDGQARVARAAADLRRLRELNGENPDAPVVASLVHIDGDTEVTAGLVSLGMDGSTNYVGSPDFDPREHGQAGKSVGDLADGFAAGHDLQFPPQGPNPEQ